MFWKFWFFLKFVEGDILYFDSRWFIGAILLAEFRGLCVCVWFFLFSVVFVRFNFVVYSCGWFVYFFLLSVLLCECVIILKFILLSMRFEWFLGLVACDLGRWSFRYYTFFVWVLWYAFYRGVWLVSFCFLCFFW